MRRALAAFVVSLATLGAVPSHGAGVEERVKAEIALRRAVEGADRPSLEALFADAGMPPEVRGRALWALYAEARPPLSGPERARIAAALAAPEPEIRLAAVRVVGGVGERLLEKETLERAASDPDTGVRVEALRAVHRWTRQGHLYYLERCISAPSPQVQAEALRNVARVTLGELPLHTVSGVRALAAPGTAPQVRVRALQALKAWGRLEWPDLKDALSDPETPEPVRLEALALSDGLATHEDRDQILLDVFRGGASLRLAWEAYRRLLVSGQSDQTLGPAVARFLDQVRQKNAATVQMAEYLREKGYRVEHAGGKWNVLTR